jgi:hypothetical protein
VRSAYYLENERIGSMHGEGSQKWGYSVIWKSIWKLQIPNPTKVFLWRASSDILPTKSNLLRRGIVKDELCRFCCSEPETVACALEFCRDLGMLCAIEFCRDLGMQDIYYF